MSDLVEFLLARIAEDEDGARHAVHLTERYAPDRPVNVEWAWVRFTAAQGYPGNKSSMFFDGAPEPARALAEAATKRRILEEHTLSHFTSADHLLCDVCGWGSHGYVTDDGCTTLRLLALPYADHPDYRKVWAA